MRVLEVRQFMSGPIIETWCHTSRRGVLSTYKILNHWISTSTERTRVHLGISPERTPYDSSARYRHCSELAEHSLNQMRQWIGNGICTRIAKDSFSPMNKQVHDSEDAYGQPYQSGRFHLRKMFTSQTILQLHAVGKRRPSNERWRDYKGFPKSSCFTT